MELTRFGFYRAKYAIKLAYDQIDTTLADMCFSNFLITYSVVYSMGQLNYTQDLFESIPDHKKIVFFLFIIQKDDN